jgi:hypothetical protein
VSVDFALGPQDGPEPGFLIDIAVRFGGIPSAPTFMAAETSWLAR